MEKTIWESDNGEMSLVEYKYYDIVDIEAPNEVDRIEKFSHPLFDSKSGHSNKPLISSSSNPKPIETNLVELSTKSESSILSVRNSVCLMFVLVVLSIPLRFFEGRKLKSKRPGA